MEKISKKVLEENVIKAEKPAQLKSKIEILDINGALNNLIIVHKEIPTELFEKVYPVKRLSSKIAKELNETREEIRENTKSPDLNAWSAAFMEKWEAELKTQVEFSTPKLTNEEMSLIIKINKLQDQGMTLGHVDLLYNLFNVE